jgi:broad specificity phosphatase PhoE
MRTLIHLVRHAEVENPRNVWYGRLEGFVLSARGRRQADALGERFEKHELAAIYSSPLERAMETAQAIAKPHDLEVQVDQDIIESETRLQGKYGDLRLFRNPLNFRYFVNPYRPSWGESYRSISDRMERALRRLLDEHVGQEVVAVSHMTPISIARLRAENRGRPPWRGRILVARASITTLEFNDDRYVKTTYEDVGSRVK